MFLVKNDLEITKAVMETQYKEIDEKLSEHMDKFDIDIDNPDIDEDEIDEENAVDFESLPPDIQKHIRFVENNPLDKAADFSNKTKDKIKKFGVEVIEIQELTEIKKNIFTTGEMLGEYAQKPLSEQSIIILNNTEVSVITGCAHPGITNIVRYVKEKFQK